MHKLIHLPRAEKRLLVEAIFTVGAIRVGLWLLPFRTLRRLLKSINRKNLEMQGEDLAQIEKAVWAVGAVSRYVPMATCLTQALAAQILLSRRGCPVRLHIGVAKSQKGRLEAHAWVESQGQVIIGGSKDLPLYTVLPSLSGEGL